jgi:hypothetical protein
MRHCRLFAATFIIICCATLSLLSVASVASAIEVTAYFYEISIAGTFGQTTSPTTPSGNFPDSTYPFPMMRGGSFDGIFVYDSWGTVTDVPGAHVFSPVSVDINIRDNTGAVANTIHTSSNFTAISSIHFLVLNFGRSFGIANGLDDFRLILTGDPTFGPPPPPPGMSDWEGFNVPSAVPPPPSEMVSAVLNFGFLATDASSFTGGWSLPVSTVSLSHTGTTTYVREVPEPEGALLNQCRSVRRFRSSAEK